MDAGPLKTAVSQVVGLGWLRDLAHKVLQMTHGRTTAFFIAFFIAGHIMAWFGKLTPVYVAYMGTLGGLVLGHSIKEDFAARAAAAAGIVTPLGGPDALNKNQS